MSERIRASFDRVAEQYALDFAGGLVLIAVHGGDGVHHFSDYKGIPVDIELHWRSREALTARVASAGFDIEASEARPPYPFEHATERVYVAARAR